MVLGPLLLVLCAPPLAAAGSGDPLSESAIDDRIRRHRTAEVHVRFVDAEGRALDGEPVTIRQTAHAFLFGAAGFVIDPDDGSPEQGRIQRAFEELFNLATVGLYWGPYEPERGRTRESELRTQVRWFGERDIVVKGHPLVWRHETPDWLPRDPPQTAELLRERIVREVGGFAGQVAIWDVVNEVADWAAEAASHDNPVTDLFQAVGDVELIVSSFATARRADRAALRVLNDFVRDESYAQLIRRSLAAGAAIDAIGVQTHMHRGYLGAEELWRTCERLGRFGKPLHFTEISLLSGADRPDVDYTRTYDDWDSTPGGERLQARRTAELYRALFSHPQVEAIVWWELVDPAWLGAPAGLLRADLTPKPAYEILRRLIRQTWWTEIVVTTDARGTVAFRGFLGRYEARVGDRRGTFAIARGGGTLVVELSASRSVADASNDSVAVGVDSTGEFGSTRDGPIERP